MEPRQLTTAELFQITQADAAVEVLTAQMAAAEMQVELLRGKMASAKATQADAYNTLGLDQTKPYMLSPEGLLTDAETGPQGLVPRVPANRATRRAATPKKVQG